MASPSPAISLLLLLSSLLAHLAVSPCRAAGEKNSISVELHHRDSLGTTSPPPLPDRVAAAVRRSAARVAHLASPAALFLYSSQMPTTYEHLISVSVGTPPVPTLAVPDTGSNLVWTRCAPCDNCTHRDYNYRNSHTYRRLPCNSFPCLEQGPAARCSGPRNRCAYNVTYGDGSSSSGILSRETFTFGSGVSVLKVVFGCSRQMAGPFVGAGVVGLGRGPTSLISRMFVSTGGKFSFCVAPMGQASGRFNLGEAAKVAGDDVVTALMVLGNPVWMDHVWLRDVTVGDVTVPAGVAVAIDPGTAVTYLPGEVVSRLEAALSAAIQLPQVADPEGQLHLCYRTQSASDVPGFPELGFGFGLGRVGLKPENTFVASQEGVVCLAIMAAPAPTVYVFGSFAMQNLHVGFDRLLNTASFAKADCASL